MAPSRASGGPNTQLAAKPIRPDQLQKIRMQVIFDGLGLGLGVGLALGSPKLGLAGGESGGREVGVAEPPAAGLVLVCDGVGEAEWLGEGDGD